MRLAVLTGLLTCVSGCGLFLDPSYQGDLDAASDTRDDAAQPDVGVFDAPPADAFGLDAFGFDAPALDASALDAPPTDAFGLDAAGDAPMAADASLDVAPSVDAPNNDAFQPDAGRPRVVLTTAAGGAVDDVDVNADGRVVVVARLSAPAQSDTFTLTSIGFAPTMRPRANAVTTVSDDGVTSVFADPTTRIRFPSPGSAETVAGITHLASAGSLFGMTLPDPGCALEPCERFEWFGTGSACAAALPTNTQTGVLGIGLATTATSVSEVYSLAADRNASGGCHSAVGVRHSSQLVVLSVLGLNVLGAPTVERRIYLNNTSRTSAMRTSCSGDVVSNAGDPEFGNDVAVMDTSDGPVLATTASNGVQFVTGSFPSVQAAGVSSVALGAVVGAPGEAVLAYTSGGTVVVERIRQGCMESRWTWSESSLAADKVRISDCVPTPDGAQTTMVVRGRDSTLIYRLNCD